MSIRLVPPREGKTPCWYGRGSYLGVRVNRSTGTAEQRLARKIVNHWKRAIERGEYRAVSAEQVASAPTFLLAAVAYMKAGGERKHLSRIIEMTGKYALRDLSLDAIDQLAIDNAAESLYPNATAATRNRQFYTPVAAILHHAGVHRAIKRPKGWRGMRSQSWLEPDQAFRLFAAADALDVEFGLFCRVLLYTGMRLSEALGVTLGQLKSNECAIYLPLTKNGKARTVHLPPVLLEALANVPPRPARPRRGAGHALPRGVPGRSRLDAGIPFLLRDAQARLFRFHAGGALRELLATAMKNAGLSFPRRQGGFHLFCHTYGTWMNRYGSLDTFGLVRTGRWDDPRSADRYRHTAASEEARRADLLPVMERSRAR